MTEAPKGVQRKRTKGWRMPPNTVYVGRGSRWGNPFRGDDAVRLFRQWLAADWPREYRSYPRPPTTEEIQVELRGKNLACWCPVGIPCHRDVLLRLANAPDTGNDRF